MRKPRTYEQLRRIEDWLQNRKCTRKLVREARSGSDLLKIPTVMTESNKESARKYDWSLLGPDMRCPREGDVYIAVRDVPACSMIYFRAPFTGGEKVLIPSGTRIRVPLDPVYENPITILASPTDYKEMEKDFVPESDLRDPKYAGYGLAIDIHEFKEGLQLEGEKTGVNFAQC